MRYRIVGLIVVAACATIARAVAGNAPMYPELDVAMSEDSVVGVLSWSPVLDRRGDAVSRYEYVITNLDVPVAAGSTTDTVARFAIAKVPGDSMVLRGEVYAVDVRGNEGARGRTPPLVVHVPDPGPVAPDVRLDTVALAPVTDLSVVGCGDTWCDFAWSASEGANAYAVLAFDVEPNVLLDSLDVMQAVALLDGAAADSALWEVMDDAGAVVGNLGMIVVREGTCAWPVLVTTCRASGLTPARRYRFAVRPALLLD